MNASFARFSSSWLSVMLIAALAATAAACHPAGMQRTKRGTASQVDVPTDPGSPEFQITRVVRNGMNPSTVLDLVGDGTGAIGRFCKPLDTQESAPGESTCSCVFSYTRTAGLTTPVTESFEVPTAYTETNLLRCKYNTVPSDVGEFRVRVRVTDQEVRSNQIVARFNVGAIDPTDWSSFAEARRFQCKDIVTIWHPTAGNAMYDPLLSDHPRMSYPLNFYSTNLAATLLYYARFKITGWDCPSNLEEEGPGTNFRVYSAQADENGSRVMWPPPTTGFNRMTFHVARKKTGVFTIPVNAYVAPQVPSVEGSEVPPIGYGASPLANDEETCPRGVSIPEGYRWVKVWLFRASLPNRVYRRSDRIPQTGGVLCNPGRYPSGGAVFPDCNITVGGAPGGRTWANQTPGSRLADRYLGTQMCVRFTQPRGCAGAAPGCSTNAAFGAGTDIWEPLQVTQQCGGATTLDPLNLCTAGTPVPYDNTLREERFDRVNRYDFLFVVTPETVRSAEMRDTSSQVSLRHTPLRFRFANDCNSDNPDTCDQSRIIRYGLKLHDVASNGDPPGDSPDRAGVFPVCALQPIEGN